MPLTLIRAGETTVISKIGGKEEVKQFLHKLGFLVGARVTVVSDTGGNLIVHVKESRVAIGKDMANKIIVNESVCSDRQERRRR